MEKLISSATRRNWTKLNSSPEGRLMSRANKTLSAKYIVPKEYFARKENIPAVKKAAEYILSHEIEPEAALYTAAVRLLEEKGIAGKPHVKKTLAPYRRPVVPSLSEIPLPQGERDLPGLLYQCILSEGRKNLRGAYYTPAETAKNLTEGFDFSSGGTFFDPCCGSGSLFLGLKNISPECIFGADTDPVAVMLAKVNLLLKFADREFLPGIFCCDYLDPCCELSAMSFTHIAANPPWGASEKARGDTFSEFFIRAYSQLSPGGRIRFLFPRSVLNVGRHRELRRFMLENCRIESIALYKGTFSGVATECIHIAAEKTSGPYSCVTVTENGKSRSVDIAAFSQTEGRVFSLMDSADLRIVKKARAKGKYSLKDSGWALGIVTGDNKTKLSDSPSPTAEPIYTGKDIKPYCLSPPGKYIKYDPSALQQSAKEHFYRAPEKLVYRFIASRPVFAFDGSGSLFLNSANILIPKVPHMSIGTVMAFMNSELMGFLYAKLFGEIKILKGNLSLLPLPEISPETDRELSALAAVAASGGTDAADKANELVYRIFGLTKGETEHVKNFWRSGT